MATYLSLPTSFFLACVLTAALVGCDQNRTVASAQSGEQAARVPTPTQTTDAQPSVETPISADTIDLKFSIIAGPAYDPSEDVVSYTIQVRNAGKAPLSSTGKFPVNLGVVIRDANGRMDSPPAKLDFTRVPLPTALQPGQSREVTVSFPLAPTAGGIVILDGVQEGVSWFSWYGRPVLEFGALQRCPTNANTVCKAQ